MLDITINNQTTSNFSYCGYDISADDAAAELLDDDMMDPLFDEDWLHENNLDLLFDLFEEEIESKVGVDSGNGSSTLFGSSPITSYLFGTSPSLASALDLLYFDNQQQAINNNSNNNLAAQHQQQHITNPQATIALAAEASTIGNTSTKNNSLAINNCNKSISNNTFNVKGNKTHSNKGSGAQQVSRTGVTNHVSSSITNAMRIKRGMKRGQSEGISLLAKPFSSNSAKTSGASGSSGSKNSSKIDKVNSTVSKNNSDKTSAKITNFKSSIIIGNNSNLSNRNGIDINYSKQAQQQKRERYYLHNCQQHAHYITGRAVIHEHAYAVRGH